MTRTQLEDFMRQCIAKHNAPLSADVTDKRWDIANRVQLQLLSEGMTLERVDEEIRRIIESAIVEEKLKRN